MKKTIALLLSFAFIFLLSSCGKKTVVDPTETTVSTSAVAPETTEKPLPYWDTHEIGTYAGLINGERFSGDFGEFKQDVKCKNGDVMLHYKYLKGMVENKNNPNLADEYSIRHPHYPYIFYDASLNRYTSAWDFYWEPYEASQNCDEIIILKGGGDYYYNETSCVVPNSYDLERIEANDEYVVRIYERSWEDENYSGKTIQHYYWKKGAGLIGIYVYEDFYGSGSEEINIRFTSKTADGWKMDETIVPNALEGSERKWPEKLWPEEYKGLDDPELLAILNEY